MSALPLLGPDSVDAIAALCARSLDRPPAADEIEGTLFAPDQPAVVRGDPAVGVVATVHGILTGTTADGFVRLLVVDPAHRGRGHGHALLAAAESDLGDAPTITVGADSPYYLFPGVETTEIAMLCLLERHHYVREETNFNMPVDLTAIPDDPGGPVLADPSERDEIAAWMARHWSFWGPEVLRGLDKGTLLLDRDEHGILGFCAWDTNRRGLLGPIAVRPDLLGRGAGLPLLLGALHRMRAGGRTEAEIAWVGPIVPYARVGATVGRVFFVYRKRRT